MLPRRVMDCVNGNVDKICARFVNVSPEIKALFDFVIKIRPLPSRCKVIVRLDFITYFHKIEIVTSGDF